MGVLAQWRQVGNDHGSERRELLEADEKGYGAVVASLPSNTRSPTVEADAIGERWMHKLDDGIAMSALTIPGTHDSAAYTNAWPFIQTQRMDILGQLNAGIRYLDLRCGLRDDLVEMVHGSAILGLKLSKLLDIMYLWLMSHPSEALVVQVKQDRKSERSTVHFSQAIWCCIAQAPERWRTANTTPVLGELRGKIQLFRRFTGPTLHAYGIDVTQWQDNPTRPFTIYTWHAVQLTIQDHYRPADAEAESLPSLIAKKDGDVVELLDNANANVDPAHWYLNFTSAYEFNLWYQLSPRGYWAFRWEGGINPRLREYLRTRKGKRRYGIVAMDFPDTGADDLIAILITSNNEQASDLDRTWRRLFVMTIWLALVATVTLTTLKIRQQLGLGSSLI
ncbi:hypothetical protein LTR91_013818 [Friedmanniomyces endolithicus]|uniref:Phosphatidylinositol-specific phospholipase C X domain-containing protein n=1 Tax=Friedmanniomyces endolithicus TaxID=329885 RepID=A0AAN6G0V3_9PEZI|nr:hypothetical protein LTS09_006410 [Friedmanniomyces endolithicus]KAK0276986.1 hypothetical protein LTS00_014396 [Friedmanniomyces endolithicus]KAK0283421.1 hypothetical protein LTR35_006496 [Friedmanniomyces endolithicus]KAK0328121.1 hypothetical protein LTR82_000048 [Friedmanniomyces endolithicus]KAK0909553.1 hypothetical protein LTR57_016263 [Friedmanniomyces endolithicus]